MSTDFDGIVKNLKFLGADGQVLTAGKSGKVPPGQISGSGNVAEPFRYFYHPDHLGSTSYVTDASGEVFQHMEYFAFGETFVEEHSNTDKTPYLFNGKELDEETGLYYYGARYYDPKISGFLSVDPLTERFPNWTPYNYAFDNPIRFVDPTGREGEDPQQEKPKTNKATETSKPTTQAPGLPESIQKDIKRFEKFRKNADPLKKFLRQEIKSAGVSADNQTQRDKAVEKVLGMNIRPGENGEVIIVMNLTKEDILNLKDAPKEILKEIAGNVGDELIEKAVERSLGPKVGRVASKSLGVLFYVLDPISTGNTPESSENTAQRAFNRIMINLIINSLDANKPNPTTIETYNR